MKIHRTTALNRFELRQRAHGYYAETTDLGGIASTNAAVSGTIYALLIGLRAGDVVTSFSVAASAGGSSLTLVKLGLYDTSGNRLVVTDDASSSFGSNGMKTVAATAPYTVPVDGGYYACFLAVGSTGPTLVRNATNGNALNAVGSGVAKAGVQTGQSDLGATQSFGTPGSGIMYWIGIS